MQVSTHELKSKIIEALKLQDVTPEQMAEQINKVVAQLMAGDFDEITDDAED